MAEISLKREYRALSIAEKKLLSKVQKSFDKEINSKLNWKAISILIFLTIFLKSVFLIYPLFDFRLYIVSRPLHSISSREIEIDYFRL